MPVKRAALLIEDTETALVVRTALDCADFACETHTTMLTLLRGTRRNDLNAILVDTSHPGVDCRALLSWRREWLSASVALLALGPDDGRSAAESLELGVDDFVSRPVRAAELLARLAAAIRRRNPQAHCERLSLGDCSLDRTAGVLVSAAGRVALTPRELALAQILFENAGRLVTRARLARDVWGQTEETSSRAIEQHVYQLRRKLRRCAGESLALRGVYGSGYRIEVDAASPLGSASQPAGQKRNFGMESRVALGQAVREEVR